MRLDLALGGFNRPTHQIGFQRLILGDFEKIHQSAYLFSAKNAHDVILKRYIKTAGSRITLPPGTAAKLIVNPSRLMPDGADNVQTARLKNLVMLFLPVFLACRPPEDDIHSAAGYICGHGHGPDAARLGDNFRFIFVVLSVLYLMGN